METLDQRDKEDRAGRSSNLRSSKREQVTMSSLSIWLALGALALVFVSSVSADDVVVLTEANFDKEIGQDRSALVEFYAPWYAKISLSVN